MKSVRELLKLNGKIYIYLKNESMENIFLEDARESGFTFSDGSLPTEHPGNDLYCLNPDYTISHVGFAGHMAFQSAATVGEQQLFRIDYEKFHAGSNDYIIQSY